MLGELQLQIAGIMSEAPLIEVNERSKRQGAGLRARRLARHRPVYDAFFMALTVIPTLRLTTRGVFDVINQRYV